MCCTSLTSAALLFTKKKTHTGPCTSTPTLPQPWRQIEVYLMFNLQCSLQPYIHQQATALLHHTTTFVGRLWWVVQPQPILLYDAKKRRVGQRIKLCYRQKQVCWTAERLSGFSTTGIHSTVGQRELHARMETFQTCTRISTETTKLSSPWFRLPEKQQWLILFACNQTKMLYCVLYLYV